MCPAEGSLAPLAYHRATKHRFDRFARSLGYLDWATQPDPFRRFDGAPVIALPRLAPQGGTSDAAVAARDAVSPGATSDGVSFGPVLSRSVSYGDLLAGRVPPVRLSLETLGEFLRCALGLSAWKSYGASRWALRVNPSSGNLHPTEAYVVWDGAVFHYAPDRHALECRARFDADVWQALVLRQPAWAGGCLVALTSIHWREAWKYGERAFRYCQHDIGHALGALRISAALLGWRMALLPDWSHRDLGALLGLDRTADFVGAEEEEPACVAVVSPHEDEMSLACSSSDLLPLTDTAKWHGHANALSGSHVPWPIIEEVAVATRYPGVSSDEHPAPARTEAIVERSSVLPVLTERSGADSRAPRRPAADGETDAQHAEPDTGDDVDARALLLQRRSATAFDPRGRLRRHRFETMLERLVPDGRPWDVLPWRAQTHLVFFVHRIEGLPAGIYAYVRAGQDTADELKAQMRPDFLWEPVWARPASSTGRLFLLAPLDVRAIARRLSCEQDIAGDGFFSLAMLSRVAAVAERGDWCYRTLFWECGLIGQMLYLEAEAAGARGTGIGCFFDDPVHDLLGLTGDAWQSLYHFSMGLPLDDHRLTTEPGYAWERPAR